MSKVILADSGYWIGLFNDTDTQHHENAIIISELIRETPFKVLFPWPCMFESLNTRLLRGKSHRIKLVMQTLSSERVELFDEATYRKAALERFEQSANYNMPLSLVDSVLCEILADTQIRFENFISFNHTENDFRIICNERRINMLGMD